MPFLPRNPEHHTADVIALHRATLENPLDDTPHLVYADAMDDAGAHEEAGTLRRLVKLRAAIGSKPVLTRPGYEHPQPEVLYGTNDADIKDHGKINGLPLQNVPHIRLRDARLKNRTYRYSAGGRAEVAQTERYLHFVPETGGAAVTSLYRVRRFEPRMRTPSRSASAGSLRTFIHSDDVKHLLGEHDAQ